MATITLPGLIDPHVHLRDLGQDEKEDFYTGTAAALAGGFTTVLDMPNNPEPITTIERLVKKKQIAKEKIVCDVGFYFGTQGNNFEEFEKLSSPNILRANEESREANNDQFSTSSNNNVYGLKVYMNHTTGNFLFDKSLLTKLFGSWTHAAGPILFHAEGESIGQVLQVVKKHPKPVHICHISTREELQFVLDAKQLGMPITCGVTPHHLFLTESDAIKLGPFGMMKPPLTTKEDQEFLWKNLHNIDVIESDHAPHSKEEKQNQPVPFGVPGLETTLPLLLTAVNGNRLTIDDIIRLCHTNPARIFHVPVDKTTTVEVDMDSEYEIKNENLLTKSKWSPFDGWKVKGKVRAVTLRGLGVFDDGEIIAKPGCSTLL